MVDINEIYKSNSDYIKAEDIGNNMWTLTIKTADVKKFDDGTSKIILSFHEWEKGLPLNVTNARAIAELYGQNSNAWVGRQIMLFSMPVDFQGKMVNAVRVRAPMQPQAAPRQPGQLQPQANTNIGGYNPAPQSPQRPINPQPMPAGAQPFAPVTDEEIPFMMEWR